MQYVILNNTLLPAAEACVSVADRGFRYGDGAFETLTVQRGVPYQFEWHMERLRKGLQAIRLRANLPSVQEQARKLLKENKVSNGGLRIQITRGSGGRGYLPDANATATILLENFPLPEAPKEPVKLWLSDYRKIPPACLPTQYKLCQGLSSTLARMEAADRACFDALMLTTEGHLCETASANLFWVKDGTLFTPSLVCGALEGALRAAIFRVSAMAVEETAAHPEVLASADEVFITNSLLKVISVGKLEPTRLTWHQTSIADQLRKALIEDAERYTQSHTTQWNGSPS